MPNLKQIVHYKNKYRNSNIFVKASEVEMVIEAFDPRRITKAFSFPEENIKKYIHYFKERRKVEVVLLFVDVVSFSSRFLSKTAEEVATFLDEYYEKVIPTIGFFGGEIEKIMGDGIICVFGEPFLELDSLTLHRQAEACAMKIVADLKDTIYESKVAFHFGEIMYYNNESDEYYEYTIVGNAITELFRLEGVSYSNSVNFFTESYFNKINEEDVGTNTTTNGTYSWTLTRPEEVNLKGVPFKSIRRIQKN